MNTKQLSFPYILEKEGITLEVNFEASDIDETFVIQRIREEMKDDLIFAAFVENKIYISCSGTMAEVIKERYAGLLAEFQIKTFYNSNTADLVLICNSSRAKLKSVIFNQQNILPILEHLQATDKIQEEAVKMAFKEFNL